MTITSGAVGAGTSLTPCRCATTKAIPCGYVSSVSLKAATLHRPAARTVTTTEHPVGIQMTTMTRRCWTSTTDPANAPPADTAGGASQGSDGSTQGTHIKGAVTSALQHQTPCTQFLKDLAPCEQQLRADLERHAPLVGKLKSLGYRTETSPTRSRNATLMPIRELMQHPQLD